MNFIHRYTFLNAFWIITIFCICSIGNTLNAQTTIVKGTVTDQDTGEPLIVAAVAFVGTNTGVNTDYDGNYELESNSATDSIEISYLGYQTKTIPIEIGKTQTIDVALSENAINLETATITAEKERYRNKDNPAVALMKKVIAQKKVNRPASYDFYEYEKYEKILLGLSNVSEKFKNRKAFKKFQFLFENLDTTAIEGQEMLPIYLKESLSDVLYRKSPKDKKEIIKADTMVTFEGYADDEGFNQYLNNLYQNIDIYDNNILILNQQFLGPAADNAPAFYKYYIQDTLMVDGVECIELFFAPRNKLDIMFQGSFYIAHKENYNIAKVDMSINSNISLNWIKAMSLEQTFEKIDGRFIQTKDNFSADFGLTKKGMGMYGSRTVSNRSIVINQPRPDEDYKGRDIEEKSEVGTDSEAYWEENRHEDLSYSESTVYTKIDSLKNVKVFKRAMNIATLALSGYTKITPYFEMGPVNTFYSFNALEGFRPRIGGRTTPNFSTKTEIETYAAYGFVDKRWKGYLGLSQALNKGNIHNFPVRRLRISAQRETSVPGQQLQFVQEDNFLLSFRRGVNNKFLYSDIYKLNYLNEFRNNFSVSLGLKHWIQTAAGDLVYRKVGAADDDIIQDLTTTEFKTILRWAPKEQFMQGKTYRIPIYNKYPIFTLRYNIGLKGFINGEYNYHDVSLNIFKRFFFNRLGYADVRIKAGKIFGEVPYPLLMVHAANQTYSFQLYAYNLMNFLEFVSDQYASFTIDHDFNGFIMNRIPLVRKLKWRAAFNFRVLYGGLQDRNDPNINDNQIAFATNEDGIPTTYSLEEKPYIEGGFGIANIFKFFRVDVIRRFNYLDHPNIAEWGVRARFKVYF